MGRRKGDAKCENGLRPVGRVRAAQQRARSRGDPATAKPKMFDETRRLREHEVRFPLCCLTLEFSGEPQSHKKRYDGSRVRCNSQLCGRCPTARRGHADDMKTTYLERYAGKP
jgi:hypothetical protein